MTQWELSGDPVCVNRKIGPHMSLCAYELEPFEERAEVDHTHGWQISMFGRVVERNSASSLPRAQHEAEVKLLLMLQCMFADLQGEPSVSADVMQKAFRAAKRR